VLVVEGLRRVVGSTTIQVDRLVVNTGRVFVLLGPTGTGKSQLLEVIAGFAAAEEGRVLVDSSDVSLAPPDKRNLSILFQQPFLFPHLSVSQNLMYASRDSARLERLVRLLRLQEHLNKPVTVLSGGEQQLVGIGRALMAAPRVLLLDEAFSAIDPLYRREVRAVFQQVQREFSLTCLLVTHSFEDALYLGDQVGVMMDGRIVQQGLPAEVFQSPSTPEVASFLGAENLFLGSFQRTESGNSEPNGEFRAQFRCQQTVIEVLAGSEGPGYVLIHPSDITLSVLRPAQSSALNNLHGRIAEVSSLGAVSQVRVQVGELLFSLVVTRQSCEALSLEPDNPVYISFKAAAVKTYPSPG
jgi:molybdate/tungstate transport system ATP-binding protein